MKGRQGQAAIELEIVKKFLSMITSTYSGMLYLNLPSTWSARNLTDYRYCIR